MKERPILFSAPMVRALLDGSKTQTRRIVKMPPSWDCIVYAYFADCWWPYRSDDGESPSYDNNEIPLNCPYGQPGDRLWVRENYRLRKFSLNGAEMDGVKPSLFTDSTRWFDADGAPPELAGKCRPSIHMPRWASRVLLEIVSVRTERLFDISEADAQREGASPLNKYQNEGQGPYQSGFCNLWRSINGRDSWDANPWVWVVEFKLVQPPPEEELPEGLWRDGAGVLTYNCQGCGSPDEWPATVEDFDINNRANMCGRSPYCCP